MAIRGGRNEIVSPGFAGGGCADDCASFNLMAACSGLAFQRAGGSGILEALITVVDRDQHLPDMPTQSGRDPL